MEIKAFVKDFDNYRMAFFRGSVRTSLDGCFYKFTNNLTDCNECLIFKCN